MSDAVAFAKWRPAPLLPGRDANDGALVLIVAMLAALACLAAIVAFASDRAAQGWIGQLSSAATVIVRPQGEETPDAAAARVAETLAGRPGVAEARALPASEVQRLVSPWLGKAADLADLPLPRLVDLRFDRNAPPSISALQAFLSGLGLDAVIDDHRSWSGPIERTAQLARWSAVLVCALLAACAGVLVAFATRAALDVRRDMIEILHLMGGRDSHIADLFAARSAKTAFMAALIGAACAAGMGALLRLAGGEGGLLPFAPVGWSDLLIALTAPPIAATIAALSARATARRLLGSMA